LVQKSKEVSVKKQLLIIFAIAALLFCVTSTASMAADKCILLSFWWTDTMTDYDTIYVLLYENGTFSSGTGSYGTWEKFGGSFLLQYQVGGYAHYAGTKKQGFMERLNGAMTPTGPHYYMTKGANKKYCEGIASATTLSTNGGPDSGQVE
jgi:hypothetical protein